MGTFHIRLEIGNVEGSRFQPVDALVDTGASLTRVPRSVLERLGVGPLEPWPFRLADDRQVQYEVGQTQIRLEGRTQFTPVVFGRKAPIHCWGRSPWRPSASASTRLAVA